MSQPSVQERSGLDQGSSASRIKQSMAFVSWRGVSIAGKKRRWSRLVVLSLLAAVAVWIVGAGVQLYRAQGYAASGQKTISDIQARTAPLVDLDGPLITDLRAAGHDFGTARSILRGVWLAPLRIAPVLGRQLRAIEGMLSAGQQISTWSAGAAESAQNMFEHEWHTPSDRPAVLREFGTLALQTSDKIKAIDLGPNEALVSPVASLRDHMQSRISAAAEDLVNTVTVANGMAHFLQGPSQYVVFAANNAEMRAGSGMLLSAGLLQANNGEVILGDMQPVEELNPTTNAPPLSQELNSLWGWLTPASEYRNLATVPNFPTTANLAAQMWAAKSGQQVDGVLVMDPQALRAVLRVTGPVHFRHGEMSASRVLDYVLHEQYLRPQGKRHREERRDDLGAIAHATLNAVNSGKWNPSRMCMALVSAAQGRHILAWSSDSEQEAAWRAGGVSGEVKSNSLSVSLLNRAGNKLDYFQDVKAQLDITKLAKDASGRLKVTIHNRAPVGEPSYVIGPHKDSGVGEGVYLGIFSVNFPTWVRDIKMDPQLKPVSAGPVGNSYQSSAWFQIARGETKTITVDFVLPKSGVLRVDSSSRIPPIKWTFGKDSWNDVAKHEIAW